MHKQEADDWRKKGERAPLKEVPVVEDRGVTGLEFPIKSGVTLLRRREFGR